MPDDTNATPAPPGQTGGTGVGPVPGSGVRQTTAVTAGTRIIGTYEIEKLINTGGMGEVYRGRNIHDGEPVAIKIVLPHLAQDEMITQLFQKEAKVLNRLVHDAIVRYYVFTNDPDIGRPCMIMEFIEGTSMNDRLKQGPMSEEDVRLLLRRLASGLEKAHAMGVVHRDLSPDNVILHDGSVAQAKIIDFGIAKSTMKGDATLLQGQFAGKFSYVAPEQLGAYGGNVDGRADIYSLALMMVAVAQGRQLNMGKSIVEAVRARAAVPDLSGVYPSLRPLLSHMLEPDPANRPADMGEVIRLLDNPEDIPEVAEPEDDDPDRTRIVRMPTQPPAKAKTQHPRGSAPRPKAGKAGAADELFVGIPGGGAKSSEPAVKSGGKGGLIAVVVAAAALAGGAGAWFAGVFDGKPPADPPAQQQAAPAAEAPAAGPQTAATETPAQPPAPPTGGTQAADPPAQPPADPPPADPPAAEPAQTAAAETPATPAADPAPDPAPAADPQPPLDAIGRQLAWLRSYDAGPCTFVLPTGAGDDAVSIEAFGKSVEPFTALLAAFTTEHGKEPDIGVRVVNDPQCPVVDYAASLRGSPTLPVGIVLDNATDVLRSGETVAGRIEGLAGRAVSLFLVNGAGGATNLRSFLSRASDGTTSFSFTVNLAQGAEPTPQILLAVVTDQPVTRLDAVPQGVTARALVPFMTSQIEQARQQPAAALRYFRLQN